MYSNRVGPEITKKLKQRFFALWARGLKREGDSDPAPVWDKLARNYTEKGRYYHCLGHLVHCLEQHDLALAEMEDPDAVEMAIWFHDVVFEMRSADNERRSAELFKRLAGDAFDAAFVAKIFGLILVTDHHTPPATRDHGLMTDIDLSGFALPWEEYLRDTQALRRENGELPDDRYYAGHRRFLEGLLGRGRIFHSDFFYRRCESGARKNIEHYLGYLERYGRVPGPSDVPRFASTG